MALMLVLAIACGSGSTEPTPVDPYAAIIGTYGLSTVNAQPLPYVLSSLAGNTTSIVSGSLALRADSIFVLTTTTRFENVVSTNFSTTEPWGTYALAGNVITLRYSFSSGGQTQTATRAGTVITLPDGPRLLVLTKR